MGIFGKALAIVGVGTVIGASVCAGMCIVFYAYSINPEMGHRHVDELSSSYQALKNERAKEA